MPAPPLLEFQVARPFGVDLGIEVVQLRPVCVGRIEVFEVRDEPGAVERAVAEVAHQRGQPAASEQATGIPHRILAVHARPVGDRRARDDDRTEQLGPHGGEQHHCPARLAVADDGRLSVGKRMKGNHALEEGGLGARDILDGLAGNGLGQEADEVAGVPSLECDADFAIGFEPTNAGTMAGARVDDDERSPCLTDLDAAWRIDADEPVVHGARQRAPVHDETALELQNMRRGLCRMLAISGAALGQDFEEEGPALCSIDPVLGHIVGGTEGARGEPRFSSFR